MGAQTDTLQWRHVYCSLYIYYEHWIARATLERARGRAMNELLNWRLSLRFCFRVAKLYTKLKKKKQYRTANYSTAHTTKKQYHYTFFLTAMTPTYNSKTAIQYHMIYNSCPLFPLLAKHPLPFLPQIRPLRQVANKLHGYIYSALATYFYSGIYLHADINGHLLRRYSHDHLEQILNTSNVEILHHLVLAT